MYISYSPPLYFPAHMYKLCFINNNEAIKSKKFLGAGIAWNRKFPSDLHQYKMVGNDWLHWPMEMPVHISKPKGTTLWLMGWTPGMDMYISSPHSDKDTGLQRKYGMKEHAWYIGDL